MSIEPTQLPSVDIAIVGGGMVGVPLAIMLSRQGWKVALVEQQEQVSSVNVQSTTAGPSLQQRCTALAAASKQYFIEHDLWQPIAADACPIRQVHVSHKGYFGATRLHAKQHGVDALGHVVNNHTMLQSLHEALADSNVHYLSGYEATAFQASENDAVLSLQRQQQRFSLSMKLAIAVDGVASALRQAAGISVKHTDYDQFAVLGNIALEDSHNHIAYERFTASGPLAMLPRPDGIASFVWCIEPSRQESVEQLNDEQFIAQLQQQFGFRLGRFKAVGQRQIVPLVKIEATVQTSERLLLLGNAARLLHPVAGQGYNLALRDVAGIVDALRHQENDNAIDPGSSSLLNLFARSRQQDQQNIAQLTDSLARAFRGNARFVSHVRSLALLGLELTPPLKNQFARRSMGFR